MSQLIKGFGNGNGVTIGKAQRWPRKEFRLPLRFLPRDAVPAELTRLQTAIDGLRASYAELRQQAYDRFGGVSESLFDKLDSILADPSWLSKLREMVSVRHYSPEYSVARSLGHRAKIAISESDTFTERACFEIQRLLWVRLCESDAVRSISPGRPVIVADSIDLATYLQLLPSTISGLVLVGESEFIRPLLTELEYPVVVVPTVEEALDPTVDQSDEELLIVDADAGEIIVAPSLEDIERFEPRRDSSTAELNLEFQLPDELSDDDAVRIALEAAELADNLHRAFGGNGLRVQSIEVLDNAGILIGSH